MMDTKCSFLNGKYKKDNSSKSEAPEEDESLLRQPLLTSCDGFKEAKRAYENGTEEVRRLLMEECALIYECNICRNMFRSLANFISHKRNFCKSTGADKFYSFPGQSSSMLIQTVEKAEPLFIKSRSTGCSPIPNTKSSNRDLSKVIERLKRVEVSSNWTLNKTLDCKTIISSPQLKNPDPALELERVSATNHAVYQTYKTSNDIQSIKTELEEVENILANRNILLGPDGKAVHSTDFVPSTTDNVKRLVENNYESTEAFTDISCETCKMPFQTEKTLKMHVQRNHSSTTYVFQCPSCSLTFLQPAAVIRHLANEHKKPLRRIRKIRDTIFKKRIQIGDVQVKGLDREVKRLQMANTKDLYGSAMSDHQNGRPISSCSYCLKNFERRAALATHLINCSARKASLKSLQVSDPNEQNIETKVQNQISNQLFENNDQHNEIVIEEGKEIRRNIKQEPQEYHTLNNNNSNINTLFENLEKQTFGNGLRTVRLENIQMTELKELEEEQVKIREEDNQSDENKIIFNDMASRGKLTKKEKHNKRFRIVSTSKQLTCHCKICNKQFNALSNLRRHISMFHYRSKRFGCNLCDYRAFRRYDIVNHLTFVHKMTGERESMAVEYVTVHEMKYSRDDVEGDIVVVNDEAIVSEHYKRKEQQHQAQQPKTNIPKVAVKTYEVRGKNKKILFQSSTDSAPSLIPDSINLHENSHMQLVHRTKKKDIETQVEGKKRPIRNRIKTVNKDFVYDLLTIKEETKQNARFAIKRSNTVFVAQENLEHIPPPVKITPYRLRTEPLMPADKCSVKGVATNVYRNVIHDALAAPSTLPELPTERPQMRSRLISSSRADLHTVPIIETSELEAAGIRSTFFHDSFLEKFAKKSNPSFKMKPLLAMQHSPLNSILQKFDASQQSNAKSTEDKTLNKLPEKDSSSPPNSISLQKSLIEPNFRETDFTPNGKKIFEPASPPATPKKRITLMERLAVNRAKTKDSLLRTTLEK